MFKLCHLARLAPEANSTVSHIHANYSTQHEVNVWYLLIQLVVTSTGKQLSKSVVLLGKEKADSGHVLFESTVSKYGTRITHGWAK